MSRSRREALAGQAFSHSALCDVTNWHPASYLRQRETVSFASLNRHFQTLKQQVLQYGLIYFRFFAKYFAGGGEIAIFAKHNVFNTLL